MHLTVANVRFATVFFYGFQNYNLAYIKTYKQNNGP